MAQSNNLQIMGILNLTPDSFSDGGKFNTVEAALKHAEEMVGAGADIIDIGAESTRPGAAEVSAEEELGRLIEPLRQIRAAFPKVKISVDTYKGEVAKKALEAGADIINDVWGGMWGAYFGGERFSTCDIASDFSCPIILMHNRPQYAPAMQNLQAEIFADFEKILENARACGVPYKNIILDGGFGFAKNAEQNLELLANYGALRKFGFPLLLGLSRKSTVKKVFGENFEEGTLAFDAFAMALESADIFRVHDVAPHRLFAEAFSVLKSQKKWE